MTTLAQQIAEKIKEKYTVGNWSRFCDEPADFDYASDDELSVIIQTDLTPLEDKVKELEYQCGQLDAGKNIAEHEADYRKRREDSTNQKIKQYLPDYDSKNEPMASAIERLGKQLAEEKSHRERAVVALKDLRKDYRRHMGQMHGHCSTCDCSECQEIDVADSILSTQPPIKPNAKYCDDPDSCTYSDCPTAFCDRNSQPPIKPAGDECKHSYREDSTVCEKCGE
jgi:predicted RNase H-like nuclease (RuvC/YqgF family)